jgi:serine/threonine-protein kinase
MSAKPGMIDPLLGKTLADRFEIIERIGEGGMGVVYKARQISVDRLVAIKVLNAQVAQDPTWVQRFINEARATSKLQHPNTIRLVDFGQSREGLLFIAMEFLDGVNLRQALERQGPMPPQRVLKILVQTCQSLAEAHALGIIHRDLKPDNLFLINIPGSPDYVKVLDFSVAKLRQQGSAAQTQAGVVFGTPQYMSPEQGRGLPLDTRSDIYALGIVAYEMLTGRVPFSSANPMEVLAMHVRTPPPPLPGVPDRVVQIVMRCLAKEPGQRYQTVEQMLADCQAAAAEYSAGVHQQMPQRPVAAEQKTLFAGAMPQVPQMPQMAPQMAQGGMQAGAGMAGPAIAAPEAKTMMAMPGMPGIANIQQQIQQLQAQRGAGGAPAASPMPSPMPDAPQRTMLLENSEGIVSFAQQGAQPKPQMPMQPGMGGMQAAPMQHPHGAQPGMDAGMSGPAVDIPEEKSGSSPLFWIICIVCGVGIGILAYIIVARMA